MWRQNQKTIDTLIGETITSIEGMTRGSDCITIACKSGRTFRMYHCQDCCESVQLEDVAGLRDSLIGYPVTMAYESTSDESYGRSFGESHTWTFYTIATVQGTVVLRWLGESNGYYSEAVDFDETTDDSQDTIDGILCEFKEDTYDMADHICNLRNELRKLKGK